MVEVQDRTDIQTRGFPGLPVSSFPSGPYLDVNNIANIPSYLYQLVFGSKKSKFLPDSSYTDLASFIHLCQASLVVASIAAVVASLVILFSCCFRLQRMIQSKRSKASPSQTPNNVRSLNNVKHYKKENNPNPEIPEPSVSQTGQIDPPSPTPPLPPRMPRLSTLFPPERPSEAQPRAPLPRVPRPKNTISLISPDSSFSSTSRPSGHYNIPEDVYEVPEHEDNGTGRESVNSATTTRFYNFGETWSLPPPSSPPPSPPPPPSSPMPTSLSPPSSPREPQLSLPPPPSSMTPHTYKSEATIQLNNVGNFDIVEELVPVTSL